VIGGTIISTFAAAAVRTATIDMDICSWHANRNTEMTTGMYVTSDKVVKV